MIRRPPRSTPKPSSAASDVYKRQVCVCVYIYHIGACAVCGHCALGQAVVAGGLSADIRAGARPSGRRRGRSAGFRHKARQDGHEFSKVPSEAHILSLRRHGHRFSKVFSKVGTNFQKYSLTHTHEHTQTHRQTDRQTDRQKRTHANWHKFSQRCSKVNSFRRFTRALTFENACAGKTLAFVETLVTDSKGVRLVFK